MTQLVDAIDRLTKEVSVLRLILVAIVLQTCLYRYGGNAAVVGAIVFTFSNGCGYHSGKWKTKSKCYNARGQCCVSWSKDVSLDIGLLSWDWQKYDAQCINLDKESCQEYHKTDWPVVEVCP